MTTRREFFRKGGSALAVAALAGSPLYAAIKEEKKSGYTSMRPELARRNFTSKAVEKKIAEV